MIKDAYDLWEEHQAALDKALERLPRCAECDEYIQDDYFFEINDEPVCGECLIANHRKAVDDYVY